MTYAELDRDSGALAGTLGELGVARGDRVALLLDKSIEAVVALRELWRHSRGQRSRLVPMMPAGLHGHLVGYMASRPARGRDTPSMPGRTRTTLLAAYRDEIRSLSALIDRDLSAWLAEPADQGVPG